MRRGDRGSTMLAVTTLAVTMLALAATGPRAAAQTAGADGFDAARPKVLVIGYDGMDPEMLDDFRSQGLMPSFDRFITGGAQFQSLGTSIPPQSPVAWSCFATGTNPGGHGIYDFIHRDPSTLTMYLSTSSSQAPTGSWRLGPWKLDRGGGPMENLRRGTAFWQLLDDAGRDVTVFKVPANFPPVACEGRTLSGMGTPDILGTYGIFSYVTDDPDVNTYVDGGRVIPVQFTDGRVETALPGPLNTYRVGDPEADVPVSIVVDRVNRTALFEVDGQEFLLAEGEWSDWVDLDFKLVPMFKSVAGICRVYLMEVAPHFRLYITPVQIHPRKPEMTISTPDAYARELADDVGLFYTQGLPEDSKALEEGVLSDADYASQSQQILDERLAQFRYELDHFARLDTGFLFFYFNSPDQSCHTFWRCFDENSPNHDEADPRYKDRVRDLYMACDRALGWALDACAADSRLMIVSDHGFAPYYRSLHTNTWLLEHGYLYLEPGVRRGETEFLEGIDWSRTRAYCCGINGLYLNLRGREPWGIVDPGQEREDLLRDLVEQLEAMVDPVTGQKPIRHAYRADVVYSGAYADLAPDIILGFESGWRGSNESALGAVPRHPFVDNMLKWSGDHCMAADVVPGVVLTSRAFDLPNPSLIDMGPTILGLFGLAPAPEMTGRNLYTHGGD